MDEWKAEKRKQAAHHEWPPCLNNPYFIQRKGSHMPKWGAASLGVKSLSLWRSFVFWLLSWLHYFRPQSPHPSHSFLPLHFLYSHSFPSSFSCSFSLIFFSFFKERDHKWRGILYSPYKGFPFSFSTNISYTLMGKDRWQCLLTPIQIPLYWQFIPLGEPWLREY